MGCISVKPIPQKYRTPFQYYLSAEDYNNGILNTKEVYTRFEEKSEQHIKIKDVFLQKNDQHLKISPWAIRYEGVNYFHLKHSYEYFNLDVYARLDLEGRYCVYILNEKSPKTITKGGSNTMGGVAGLLSKSANKKGNTWIDALGNAHKILIADTHKLKGKFRSPKVMSDIDILKENNFNEILPLDLSKKEIKKLSFEDCMNLIAKENYKFSKK